MAAAGYDAVDEVIDQLQARLGQLQPTWMIGRVSEGVLAATFHAADCGEAERRVQEVCVSIQGACVVGASPIDAHRGHP